MYAKSPVVRATGYSWHCTTGDYSWLRTTGDYSSLCTTSPPHSYSCRTISSPDVVPS